MSRFEIILINANDFDINHIVNQDTPNFLEEEELLKLKCNYLDFDKTKDLLKDICITKDVDKDNFMSEIVNFIGLDEEHFGDIKDCHESKDFTYQIMYKLPNQEDDINKLKYNLLASYLTFDKELIYGNVV